MLPVKVTDNKQNTYNIQAFWDSQPHVWLFG